MQNHYSSLVFRKISNILSAIIGLKRINYHSTALGSDSGNAPSQLCCVFTGYLKLKGISGILLETKVGVLFGPCPDLEIGMTIKEVNSRLIWWP